ncbi:UNVERIFIED_CONTAM: F-box protein skip16 [Siphonaria sp. JEL0065]|nr:F-box protein skip16 [Siphonaria sp. JEL0065]
MGEFLGLVTSGSLTGHVVRFGRASLDLDRMGPIPKGFVPFFDLGLFRDWFNGFVQSLDDGVDRSGNVDVDAYDDAFHETVMTTITTMLTRRQRRLETVLGRGGRELVLPSVFLDSGPGTGVAVTHGIKVQVSSFFMLSMARVCYRITLTYLPTTCPHATVQLKSRKWAFRYLNGRYERVQGDGVIGYYPLLSLQNPSFSYCSYSDGGRVIDDDNEVDAEYRDHDPLDPYAEGRSLLSNPVVSCQGSFTFIPGRIEAPSGQPFEVEIPFVEFVRPQVVCVK